MICARLPYAWLVVLDVHKLPNDRRVVSTFQLSLVQTGMLLRPAAVLVLYDPILHVLGLLIVLRCVCSANSF
jgi:hypothetical protein